MKIFRAIAVAFILPVAAMGQQFEQVSLRPAQAVGNVTFHSDAITLSAAHNTLKQLMQRACGVADYQIAGPDWLIHESFDFAAKFPEFATEHTVIGGGSYLGSKINMAVLAQYLTTVVGTPVTDSAGLTGIYDITLSFPSIVGLPLALSDGLGLRLDKRNAPVDMLVVDHVEEEISR